MNSPGDRWKTVGLSSLAMIAFAANSVLCRQALSAPHIDASSFTTIRLFSGAITLWFLAGVCLRKRTPVFSGPFLPAIALFLYAACFSFAYRELTAGTGALILFGGVQATMMLAGLLAGERLRSMEWLGFIAAAGGLVFLVSPGLTAPSFGGSVLMLTAGVAWGVYSVLGRAGGDPVLRTTANFIRAVPLAVVLSFLWWRQKQLSPFGVSCAVASGALTSGCGYVIWYAALKGLSTTRASIVQLSVPVLAAIGGVLFLSETVSLRLLVSSVLILGGIFVAVRSHSAA